MSSRPLNKSLTPSPTERGDADPSPCERDREKLAPLSVGEGSAGKAETIRAEALRLGFSACGFAKAGRVSAEMEARVRQWLDSGGNAGMAYMANHLDMRIDPRLLMPDVKTIVSVALNYAPAQRLPEGEPQISAYALGKDYHEVVKHKLRQLAAFSLSHSPSPTGRVDAKPKGDNEDALSPLSAGEGATGEAQIYCDTAPVLERYWAVQAGLGWIGRNHQLIIPHAGSMFFLGELFLDFELPYDKPMENRCGTCHRCVDACPTGALRRGRQFFDASLCLSYQTIENRGELSEEAKAAMGDMFYGCDRCQTACPWNRFAKPNATPELQPNDELLHMTREKWHNLSIEDYRRIFKGSAVKRAKYEGIKRNIENLK